MLERPRLDVLSKRGIESLPPQYLVAKHLHHQRGLLVSHPEEIVYLSWIRDQWLFFARPRVLAVQLQGMHFDGVAVRSPAEILRSVPEVDEGVEALVHPRIEPLVGADGHREPFVAEFVGDYPLLILPRRAVRRESQHRVFHSLDRALDGCRVRPRVVIPLLAEIPDRLSAHAIHFRPLVSRRTIETLDQDSLVAARVPAEVRTSGEGEVPDVACCVVPGKGRNRVECRQLSLRVDPRTRRLQLADFLGRDDRHRRPGFSCSRETGTLCGSQHLLRIRQLPGCSDDVGCRDGERDVKVTVLQIELTGAYVRLVIPSPHIVVNGHARVPLRDLVERTIVAHASPTLRRDVEPPSGIDEDRRTGRERRRQIDPHRRSVDRVLRIRTGDAERVQRQAAVESLAREVERRSEEDEGRLIELVGDAGWSAEILLNEQPKIREAIGRVVDVLNGLAAANFVTRGVECGRNPVVGLLLPVPGPGTSASGSDLIGRGKIEWAKRRRIRRVRWWILRPSRQTCYAEKENDKESCFAHG